MALAEDFREPPLFAIEVEESVEDIALKLILDRSGSRRQMIADSLKTFGGLEGDEIRCLAFIKQLSAIITFKVNIKRRLVFVRHTIGLGGLSGFSMIEGGLVLYFSNRDSCDLIFGLSAPNIETTLEITEFLNNFVTQNKYGQQVVSVD